MRADVLWRRAPTKYIRKALREAVVTHTESILRAVRIVNDGSPPTSDRMEERESDELTPYLGPNDLDPVE